MCQEDVNYVQDYVYNAKVVSVYDGDTVTITVNLGFYVNITEKFRLLRINTPEIRGEEREAGLISRDALRELILDKDVVIKTFKDRKGKYGRYLVEIYLGEINVNDWLVENGYAIYQNY